MTRAARIAVLNDLFRSALPFAASGRTFMTRGVAALPPGVQLLVLKRVRTFAEFTPDNDPHGEHDFGRFEVDGERVFWKIDYFADANLDAGSEDPSDPAQCYRVLTIMLASEY